MRESESINENLQFGALAMPFERIPFTFERPSMPFERLPVPFLPVGINSDDDSIMFDLSQFF